MGKFGRWQTDFERETRMMKLDSHEYKAIETKYLRILQEYNETEFVKSRAARAIMNMIEPTRNFRVSHLQCLRSKELYELLCAVEILYEQMVKCGYVPKNITRNNSSSF